MTTLGKWYDIDEFTPSGVGSANYFSSRSFIKDDIMVVNHTDHMAEGVFIYKKIENSWVFQTEISKPPGATTFASELFPLENTFLVDTNVYTGIYAEYSLSTYAATGTTFTIPSSVGFAIRSNGNVIVALIPGTTNLLIYENFSLIQTFPLNLDTGDFMVLYNVRGNTIACLILNGGFGEYTTFRKIIVIKRVDGTWTFDRNIIDTNGPGSLNVHMFNTHLELFEDTIIYTDVYHTLVIIEDGVVTNRLRPSELSGFRNFVKSCSIYGKYIVVSTGLEFGYKAYVYEKTNQWNLIQTITSPEYTSGLREYNRVYLTKNDLLVSASKIDNTGNSFLMMFTFYPNVSKPPPPSVAGDGTGAVLTLHAEGKQDTFLDGKEGTYWKTRTLQHTNFTRFQKAYHYNKNVSTSASWPFGNRIRFQIDPKESGDILSNMYLKITLPSLPDPYEYTDQIGRAIIKEVSFKIDGTTIETITDNWSVLNDEIYANESEKIANRNIINAGQFTSQLPGSGASRNPIPLYIPLGFFFCRTHTSLPGSWDYNQSTDTNQGGYGSDTIFKPYMFLCACRNNMIHVDVEFHNTSFFTNYPDNITTNKILLVTEEYVVTDKEREYIQSNPIQTVISSVSRHPVQRLDKRSGVVNAIGPAPSGSDKNFSVNLVGAYPTKALHWFMRNQEYENENDNTEFLNRYNFSTNSALTDVTQENNYQVMEGATMYLGSKDVLGFVNTRGTSGANYYKHVQPYQHGLSTPDRNIYSYSFCLQPKNPTPTGAVNFSTMTSSKTTLDGSLSDAALTDNYSLYMYTTGFKVINYENGSCNLRFM